MKRLLVAWLGLVVFAIAFAWTSRTRAAEPILAPKTTELHLESIETALTAYEQRGFGYQSQAGPSALAQGSERLVVFQEQVRVTVSQGERFRHTVWLPLDVVTAASPNSIDKLRPPDMMSTASMKTQAGAIDWTVAYKMTRRLTTSIRNAFHLEENFRAWTSGVIATYSLAGDAATVAANVTQIHDWFDKFDVTGVRYGRATRNTTSGSLGFTQILTPTTVVHANYGFTAQNGELSNTWNSVPMVTDEREGELVPAKRLRHAIVGRGAQWLPWNGALKASYRFYVDDWGIVAHSVEAQLLQRLAPWVYVRGSYRYHTQTAVDFFTTLAPPGNQLRTSDSDLAAFDAHSIGGKASFEVPGIFEGGHVDAGYERYFRTDHLRVNVFLWQAGARF